MTSTKISSLRDLHARRAAPGFGTGIEAEDHGSPAPRLP